MRFTRSEKFGVKVVALRKQALPGKAIRQGKFLVTVKTYLGDKLIGKKGTEPKKYMLYEYAVRKLA